MLPDLLQQPTHTPVAAEDHCCQLLAARQVWQAVSTDAVGPQVHSPQGCQPDQLGQSCQGIAVQVEDVHISGHADNLWRQLSEVHAAEGDRLGDQPAPDTSLRARQSAAFEHDLKSMLQCAPPPDWLALGPPCWSWCSVLLLSAWTLAEQQQLAAPALQSSSALPCSLQAVTTDTGGHLGLPCSAGYQQH